MSLSNLSSHTFYELNTDSAHQSGDGRQSVYTADSESYSANTLDPMVSKTNGSH